VVLLSGAFGWTPVVQETAARIAGDGHPVLGVESPEYFKRDLDPATLASDLKTMREFVNRKSGRPVDAPVILGGFAYGAEMIPYVLNRTGTEGVQGLLLVAADAEGASVFRVSIQLKMASPPGETFDVAAEIARLPPLPTFLIQGEMDEAAAGRRFLPLLRGRRHLVVVPGGNHQFRDVRGHYLAQVSQALRWLASEAAPPAGTGGPESPGGPPGL
jgi:type IV secretory pathway VirJ component